MLVCAGRQFETTSEGFLTNPDGWDSNIAAALADAHGLQLEETHWQVLTLLRAYFDAGNEPPSMRRLSSLLKTAYGAERSGSIYLMKLFGPSPAKMAARIAGLPKPRNCF